LARARQNQGNRIVIALACQWIGFAAVVFGIYLAGRWQNASDCFLISGSFWLIIWAVMQPEIPWAILALQIIVGFIAFNRLRSLPNE